MQCIAHPTKAASNTCSKCNHWLCDECTVDVKGRILCRSCITEMERANPEMKASEVAPGLPPIFPPPRIHRSTSFGLLFLFSFFFPPGANYMYMGLIKRGLAAMCGFFLIIYLMVVTSFTLLFALVIPVFWLTCVFDGFHVRRRMNAGENVEDGIGDILSSLLRNKFLTAAVLVIIAVAVLGFVIEILSRIVPLLLIVFALYLIFRRKR